MNKFVHLWPHILVGLFIFILSSWGSGYRAISQDEAETAVRGQTILQSGFPQTMEKNGNVAVFAGGREIENGVLHRYTPWGQFYPAAVGVGLGRLFNLNQDWAVRQPFIFFHATTGSLISYGLTQFASLHPAASVTVAILASIQTDRLIHNRTARYHAMMDLFVLLGIFGCAGIRNKKKWGLPLVSFVIFSLPHIHTIGGSITSLVCGIWATAFLFKKEHIKTILLWIVLPGFVSIITLVLLTRPWAQSQWGEFEPYSFIHSFYIHRRYVYAYFFVFIAGLIIAITKKEHRTKGLLMITSFAAILTFCPIMDRHVNSLLRYYFPLWLMFIFWPIALGVKEWGKWGKNIIYVMLFALVLIPEFSTRRYDPYQGLKIAFHDISQARNNIQQPLHEAITYIRDHATKEDAILFDSVPLLSNWYFPHNKVALVPDLMQRHPLSQENPIWDQPLNWPDWHVWFPTLGTGIASILKSDYRATHLNLEQGHYFLTSDKLNKTGKMCIRQSWKTNIYNNNTHHLYFKQSFTPTGGREHIMVLAQPCEGTYGTAR